MLIFPAEEHIDRWCKAHGLERGATLTPEQGWQLARGWYAEKLKPEWRRHTVEEAEALLAEVGLTGAFGTSAEGCANSRFVRAFEPGLPAVSQ